MKKNVFRDLQKRLLSSWISLQPVKKYPAIKPDFFLFSVFVGLFRLRKSGPNPDLALKRKKGMNDD